MFIHGLGGEAFATWRHGEDDATSWPHWLAKEFPDVGVWSLGYPASPTKWTRFLGLFSSRWRDAGYGMSLPDRALQALDLMVHKGLGQRPLLLICHSLGGLVAKQILRKADDSDEPRKKQVAAQTCAVLFVATPHAGARLATMVSAFRAIFGPTVSMDDLRAHDANLRDLYDWYRRRSAGLRIQTVTYYETRGVKGVLPIVDPTSANPGVGADPVGLDEDHVSIAKPRERDALICLAAHDLLRQHVLAPRPTPQARSPLAEPVRTSEIVQELPPRAEKHFGRETELRQLTERLRAGKDCAVVGPAGLGKTALAAEALREVVGETPATLAASPFRSGVVYLDLYTLRGQASAAWNSLANALAGVGFMAASPARERAIEACRARRVLIILEGGEEADGKDGRASIPELCSVFSPQNRRLLLTRDSGQTDPAETVALKEVLHPADAADLLDSLTHGRVTGAVRDTVLALAEGHPLALTWAGGLLARDDDDPGRLAREWQGSALPGLSDPEQAQHTLEWLFNRSVRRLDDTPRLLLAAAGLLAHAPFPLTAMLAASGDTDPSVDAIRDALKALIRRGLLRMSVEADHWQFTHVLGYRFARKETGSDPALRERLSLWLSRYLKAALEQRLGPESVPSLTRPLEHGAALLRADDDERLWRPLANDYLYFAHDRLMAIGRLDLVKLALGAVADWLARLPGSEVLQPPWLRERSVLLNHQGDVLRDQGDLAGALVAFRESMEVRRRLTEADPANTGWQRDLSVCHNKVGDILRAQGDLTGTLAVYRESLEVRRRLAEVDWSNADSQRDLSVCQDRIGDVLRDQGDLAGALVAYRESQEVIRRLAEAERSNAGRQRDLSVCHNKMGDVLKAQGDLAGALAAYRESLEVRRHLAEADRSNAGWQRDLSVCHSNVGDVLIAQGDLAGALDAYRESLEVIRRLAEADRLNASWQRDLSVSHNKVGDVLIAQGDLAGALAAFKESLGVIRHLAETDRANAGWQRDLSVSHNKVGDVLSSQSDLAGALAAYQESLEVRRHLTEADRSNAGWQRDLSLSLMRMALVHEKQGNATQALPLAEESLAIGERLATLDRSNVAWQNDVSVSRALVERLRG